RYLGIEEPLYAKKGHIPGAINYFWGQAVDENGLWKDEERLREHFKDLPKDKPIIMSCGSGVSACGNILALRSLGFDNVKLYPGGFSDWISYDDNKVERKDESKLNKKRKESFRMNKTRCHWVTDDPLYIRYHDEEW